MVTYNATFEDSVELDGQALVTMILRQGDVRVYQRFIFPAEIEDDPTGNPGVMRPSTIGDVEAMAFALAALSTDSILADMTISVIHAPEAELEAESVGQCSDIAPEYTAKLLLRTYDEEEVVQLRAGKNESTEDYETWLNNNSSVLYSPGGKQLNKLIQVNVTRERAARQST